MAESNICPCGPECALRNALQCIGGKWKIPILCSLIVDGPSRYNELLKKISGLSNTMLSQTLKELEADHLVERKEFVEVPIRVEYAPTNKAKHLRPIMEQLIQWSMEED